MRARRSVDSCIDLAAGFLVHLFDAGGMNSAVRYKLFERQTRDLAANRIEARNGDSLGRVIDYQIDAGYGFERADISALASDYAAFHLVVGQGDNGYRGLRRVVCGAALDSGADYLSCNCISFVLCALLIFEHLDRLLVNKVVFKVLEQVFLSLLLAVARDFFEHIELASLEALRLGESVIRILYLAVEGLVLLFEILDLLVETLFFLNDSALLALNFIAPFAQFFFVFASLLVNLILGFKDSFLLLGLCLGHSLADYAVRLLCGGTYCGFGNSLPM